MSLWYRAGSVTVTNNSNTVNCVAGFWETAVNKPAVGDIFTFDNQTLYEIVAIDSDTALQIDRPYEGSTDTGDYAIIRNTSATTNTRLAAQVQETLTKLGDKITVSTTAPSAGQGKNGDIWIVVAST